MSLLPGVFSNISQTPKGVWTHPLFIDDSDFRTAAFWILISSIFTVSVSIVSSFHTFSSPMLKVTASSNVRPKAIFLSLQ